VRVVGGPPAAASEIVVSVADTGMGIPAEDHERVFEQFAQSGGTLTDKPRGTGRGPPICREIVELHGGRIWLDSTPGVGSTFSFSLPCTGSLLGDISRMRDDRNELLAAGFKGDSDAR
jgi:signal transduction histidine kinase